MKISLWIPAMLLCYVAKIASPSCIQVGTVLFTTTDLVKKCWTESDKALLTARLVMQDVLPDPDCIDFSKPDAVITLLEYFQSCYKIISVSTYGKLQNLMLLALSDAIGGYLRAYVLPLTRRAFYAGTVNYCDAKKLFQLFDDIKVFLKTNGVGWAKPKKLCGVQFKPKPLVLSKGGEASACSELYTIEKNSLPTSGSSNPCSQELPPSKLESKDLLDKARIAKSEIENSPEVKKFEENLDNRQETLKISKIDSKVMQRKKRKRYYNTDRKKKNTKRKKEIVSENNEKIKVQKLRENLMVKPEFQNNSALKTQAKQKYTRQCENIGEKMSSKVVIPLPTLDDPRAPYTIAVPFKIKPLRKVKNQMSAFVLEHYYSSVIKCMLSKESSKTSIKNFNAAFNSWLESQILPLLENEEWYPAFGGVLRVIETIKKLGCRKSFKEKDFKDIGFMFPDVVEVDNPKKGSGRDQVRDVENISMDDRTEHTKYYIMYGFFTLGIVGVFAICTLCVFCCASRRSKSRPFSSPSSVSSSSKAKKSKTLDFQFLIQFFKKKEGEKYTNQSRKGTRYGNQFYRDNNFDYDTYDSTSNYVQRVGIENGVGENAITEASNRKKSGVDVKNVKEKGGGDFPSLTPLNFESQKQYIKSILSPFWPYHSSYAPYKKMEKNKSYPQEENLQQNLPISQPINKTEVETIWKKPNKRLKKSSDIKDKTKKKKSRGVPFPKSKNEVVTITESETISAEESRRRCSSCGYSETPNSQLISTNTSQTQEAFKLNSSALKFSEPAIVRRKTKGNHSAKCSTGESYSEGEASYSTESDSSETTLN